MSTCLVCGLRMSIFQYLLLISNIQKFMSCVLVLSVVNGDDNSTIRNKNE